MKQHEREAIKYREKKIDEAKSGNENILSFIMAILAIEFVVF